MIYQPATGNIDKIIYNKKTEFVKANDSKILVLYGATGNGKSMHGLNKLLSRIFRAKRHERTFILAGKDIKTLEKRFINSASSVLNWKPYRGKWVYKMMGVGGSKVEFKTRTGLKYLYLTPFSSVSDYSRLLGDTINGAMVDEAVESDENFIREMVSRINRTVGSFGIFTSNGGDVEHYFHTGVVNKCRRIDEYVLEGIIPTPEIELKYFDEEMEKNDKWMYVHMSLEDNPTYTEEQLAEFYKMFPMGSFMHFSRILGVRGFDMNSPFSPFLSNIWLRREELGEFYPRRIVFSVDSGGHVFSKKEVPESEYVEGAYGTGDGGHTIMMVGGFDSSYRKFLLIDVFFPNHMHSNINVERIQDKVYNINEEFPRARKQQMFVDPADPSMLSMLRDRISGIEGVSPAVKRDNSINLDETVIVSMIQQWMMNGMFKMLDTANNRKWTYPALLNATLESNGKMRDNGRWDSDVRDSMKYIFSSMYMFLVNALE